MRVNMIDVAAVKDNQDELYIQKNVNNYGMLVGRIRNDKFEKCDNNTSCSNN